MITQKTEKNSVISLALVSSLLFLMGCFGEKSKVVENQESLSQATSGKGELLLSIDGKPVLYSDDFEEQKALAQQSNQQLNMILQMMPEAEYSMLFKSIEAGYLMKECVMRSGIDQTPENIKRRQKIHEQIDLQVYMGYYEEAHPIEVTEHEIKTYYQAKRDQIPGLVITPASVEIMYVNFDTKDKAEKFATKVRDGSEKHMQSAAKEANVKVETMTVSAQSTVNDALKNSVLAATKFPSKEVVKMDEKSYCVVGMLKKQEAQYHNLENPQVKEFIKKSCKDEKREAELAKQIEKLNKEYNVVENVAYFENKKQNKTKALNAAEQIVMQAQAGNGQVEEIDIALLDDKI